VHEWFASLVDDDDILKSTTIDIDSMAAIVAAARETIQEDTKSDATEQLGKSRRLQSRVGEQSKVLVDVGVLRFPDPTHPFFKVSCCK
jgi:hypothetical protein